MSNPRPDLPFFAYGLFKPGQLGFLRLQMFVQHIEPDCVLNGTLRERDGLPIIDKEGRDEVTGSVLIFENQKTREAYESINEIEPSNHYRWEVANVRTGQGREEANVLFGRSPKRGSAPLKESEWDGRKDPFFTSALVVVQETLEQNKTFEGDLKRLFRLQMAYLLLWSAIERYASLRYHLGGEVSRKVSKMANEKAFGESLKVHVSKEREIYRADKPRDKELLDSSDPGKSLDYYYQVRSNATHRGKAAIRDFDTLKCSLKELHAIFCDVLNEAFKASEDIGRTGSGSTASQEDTARQVKLFCDKSQPRMIV